MPEKTKEYAIVYKNTYDGPDLQHFFRSLSKFCFFIFTVFAGGIRVLTL